jgi:phosphopantetheine--protein transferase-like protein
MYAKLTEAGVLIEDYLNIDDFAGLLQRANGKQPDTTLFIEKDFALPLTNNNSSTVQGGIGIDIEEIVAMPETGDFREDEFYKMNFSSAEIAYCILQPQPYASFTGLFAAKEAIIKANNVYRGYPFNSINIDHAPDGKPWHPAFQLSIAHTGNLAVAVAIQFNSGTIKPETIPAVGTTANNKNYSLSIFISLVSFLLALIALVLALRH